MMFGHLKVATFFLLAAVLTFSLSGCEDDETNKIAQAQNCLDKARTSADASKCWQYVENLDSQQANIIKCSVKFIEGGLTTSKIADAYSAAENETNSDDQQAVLVGYLALSSLTTAQDADYYCDRSQIAGLMYLSNLAVLGTVIKISGGLSDTPTAADLETALDNCISSCTQAEKEAIAESVGDLAEEYCSGSNAEEEFCQDIDQADTYTDDTKADAMMCLLNGDDFLQADFVSSGKCCKSSEQVAGSCP